MTKPKYSLIEIEMRWLVDKSKLPDISSLKRIEVTDKYFSETRTRLRSMIDTSTNEVIFKLTKKYGKISPYSEPITTLYLSEYEYDLYNKMDGNILRKNIYHYYFKEKKFLIEIFTEPAVDFVLLEAEESSEEALHQLPVPEFVIRDVTAEKKFEGYSISNCKL